MYVGRHRDEAPLRGRLLGEIKYINHPPSVGFSSIISFLFRETRRSKATEKKAVRTHAKKNSFFSACGPHVV